MPQPRQDSLSLSRNEVTSTGEGLYELPWSSKCSSEFQANKHLSSTYYVHSAVAGAVEVSQLVSHGAFIMHLLRTYSPYYAKPPNVPLFEDVSTLLDQQSFTELPSITGCHRG